MNFKDWCMQIHGITGFREGKISNSIFLPVFPGEHVQANYTIEKNGGYVIDTAYMRGYVISIDNYQQLEAELFLYFSSNILNKMEDFNEWLYGYFKSSRVNLRKQSEYREPSTIHLVFDSEEHLHQFSNAFSGLDPVASTNALAMTPTLQMPAHTLSYLQNIYYQQVNEKPLDAESIVVTNEQIAQLHELKNMIVQRHLTSSLDYANILSRDYSNIRKNGVSLTDYQAASAYAMSLKIYAEIHRDSLDEEEYLKLIINSSLLAAYSKDGILEQSLKTDAYFVSNLIRKYVAPHRFGIHGETPIFRDLPKEVQEKITFLIRSNTTSLLHGNPNIPLGKGAFFKMKRFLPDEWMNSETNEIIFQGGGMSAHSALFRLIKVGILADGTRANPQQKPLYFEYYKVVHNLGLGSRDMDHLTKTCSGTYITHLNPCVLENGQFISQYINPFFFPQEYQNAMEHTIRQLISSERYVLFYYSPENAPCKCPEVNEWMRLHAVNQILSGQPYAGEVEYYSNYHLVPSLFYLCSVVNQRNFYQEGGSCTVFSLKSLVSSGVGLSLSALHSTFMQLNGSLGHIDEIEKKISLLQHRLAPHTSASLLQYQGSFFNKQELGVQLLKSSGIEGANSIHSAVYKYGSSGAVVIINCEQPALLAASIEARTGIPKLITDQNKLFIDLPKLHLLCSYLSISYNALINTLPQEFEDPRTHPN